jgi:peptide/nickel transport system substrate-binding protein
MWGDLSESLFTEVAYIPLAIQKFLRLHGSGVTNYQEDPASNGYPDMGLVGRTSGGH